MIKRLTKRMMRGLIHILTLIGAMLRSEQREMLRHMIGILHRSRELMDDGGLPALMRGLDQQAGMPRMADDSALRLADALAALMPVRPFRHCMKRSILRYVILKSQGANAAFMIGVARPDRSALQGHAWVTLDDAAFREDDDQHQRMTPIFSYPAR